jgi:DNA-directed RNA polymerase specialized sigma24 family protein
MDEDKAIAYLLKANEKPVYSYVIKNEGNRDAASILLVEGVTELILNIRTDKFKEQSSINTYLFSICRSLWLRKLKLDKRHVELSDQKMNSLVHEPSNPVDLDKLRFELSDLLENIGNQCKQC